MNGYWIVLSNIGGIVDKRFVPKDDQFDEDSIRNVLINFVTNIGMFFDGDKITIEEGSVDKKPEKAEDW